MSAKAKKAIGTRTGLKANLTKPFLKAQLKVAGTTVLPKATRMR